MAIEKLTERNRVPVSRYIAEHWAGPMVISRGVLVDSGTLPGFVWEEDGRVWGGVLYQLRDGDCEIAVLYSEKEGCGVAWQLIQAVLEVAREQGCGRVWLITTNDNTHAIRYYQKRGFSLKAVHIGAMAEARRQKPGIALTGHDGIPILHEVEFEMSL